MTAKTDALLIRLTPEDRARLQRTAEAHYLDTSTWARQVLLRAVAEQETAAPPPKPAARRSGRKTR
jgi:hypothetical protein